MFITFEGIDGSGKSTQLERLAEKLRAESRAVLVTRNPGDTEIGKQLREILLHHKGFFSPRCEMFLYLADRAQHVDEVIRPALDDGKIVLCDRYIDSTAAYQGGGRGLPLSDIEQMNHLATGGLVPDKTFLFDAPAEVLLGRAQKRSAFDRLEQETLDFYQRVRENYQILAATHPERFIVLDAQKSIEQLAKEVFEHMSTLV